MDSETLRTRIISKENAINKLDRKILKLASKLGPKVTKVAKENYKLGLKDWHDIVNQTVGRVGFGYDLDDLRSALRDMDDYVATLNKYKNALVAAEAKENKLSEERVKIIWEFLLQWKAKAADYIRDNTRFIRLYYDTDKEHCEMWNNSRKYIEEMGREEFKARLKELENEVQHYKACVHPIASQVYSYHKDSINEELLDKILTEEAEAKYLDMIERVTDITGEITDASNLEISPQGDIDGIITGKDGVAKIQTIGAGGYNTGRIVNVKRGPIFHFRVLVRRIK